MTTIGDLKYYVTIEKVTRGADDGAGGALPDVWVPYDEVWSDMEPGGGKEIKLADQVTHRVAWKFTMRRRTDITAAMRISYDGRTFGIIGTPIYPKDQSWMVLQCEEGVPINDVVT